ncbi:MAG: trypsin-like peptidase domain-containing protein [Lachnospiraceae bacterium]|nr:trypsin-like peptidase domain-containing protein [Lachnospiraceae bacterium]
MNYAGQKLLGTETVKGHTEIKQAETTVPEEDEKESGLISGLFDDKKDKGKDFASEDEEKIEDKTFENEGSDIDSTGIIPVGENINDVSDVVKAVMPSVVSVNKSYTATMDFFGQRYSQEATGSGSGIIVGESDSELLLVTNYHVVESADELAVVFCNDETAPAQIKGTDPGRDLAVIVVQLEDITDDTADAIRIANLGDSTDLEVGEPVIAIGNALGYGQSVTTGVVSALNRAIGADTTGYGDSEPLTFIQTDAAINFGNSGGALLNMKGEVVGINSNKLGGNSVEGMGYAIPISDAKPIITKLVNRETKLKVDEDNRGYLGITGVSVEKEYSQVYGMPIGVYISSVSEGSGADKAGLVRGDVITAINGQSVESMEALKEEMQYYSAGTRVRLTIMQGSPAGYNAKEVEVVLGSIDDITS